MEKSSTITHDYKDESIVLIKRNNLKLTGITEVLSSSDTNITLKLKDTTLNISGSDINITKLDIELGNLEANGKFDKFTYGKDVNIFKRLFK